MGTWLYIEIDGKFYSGQTRLVGVKNDMRMYVFLQEEKRKREKAMCGITIRESKEMCFICKILYLLYNIVKQLQDTWL